MTTPKSAPSRQLAWQRRKRAKGLCITCGKCKRVRGHRDHCAGCLARHRESSRRRVGSSPRWETGRGRPYEYPTPEAEPRSHLWGEE